MSNELYETVAKVLANLDSAVISCRLSQIELGKVIANLQGLPEEVILNSLKKVSLEILKDNGLDY